MSQFDEIRETHYSSSVQAFYESIGREGGGGGGFCPAVVRPSTSDFLADVELAARAALSAKEFELFKQLFLDKKEVAESVEQMEDFIRAKNTIMAKVGKMFLYRGIHPVSQYFKPVDTR